MTYKERILCPQCGRILTTVKQPQYGEAGIKYCYRCNESHTWDVYSDEGEQPSPIRRPGKKQRYEKEYTCVVCGRKFTWQWRRKTCCEKCFKELTRRNAVANKKAGCTPSVLFDSKGVNHDH
jgi:transcription elongation factor Elf1